MIMRSVWDYHLRRSDFQRWLIELAECDLRLFNPVSLIQWNLDKIYLSDLASAGVDVIPTVWAGKSSTATNNHWADITIGTALGLTSDLPIFAIETLHAAAWAVERLVALAAHVRLSQVNG